MAVSNKKTTIKWRKGKRRQAKTGENSVLTRFPGRTEYVGNDDLISCRDALVGVIENAWCDVGWRLERLRDAVTANNLRDSDAIGELRQALRFWNQEFYSLRCPPIQLLLTEGSVTTQFTATQLRAMSQEPVRIGHAKREVSGALQEYRNLHQLANSALLPKTLRLYEADVLRRRIAKLAILIADKEVEYQTLVEAEPRVREQYRQACSSFAQMELLDFLRQRRNKLTPVRIANAIAGLPFISWRQSAKRCTPQKCGAANGHLYRTVTFIVRSVESRAWQTDLATSIGKKVYAKHPTDASVISELRHNWPSLKAAIELVLSSEAKDDSAPRPYRIAAEYLRLVQNPSQADRIVDQIDRVLSR